MNKLSFQKPFDITDNLFVVVEVRRKREPKRKAAKYVARKYLD